MRGDRKRRRCHKEKTIAHHMAENPTTVPEVRHVESWMQNLALRVGAVPVVGAPVPAVIRRQRWSPFDVPSHLGRGWEIALPVHGMPVAAVSSVGHP